MSSKIWDRTRPNRANSERGSALVGAIYVMAITTILGTAIMAAASNQTQQVEQTKKKDMAFNAAESAAEWAIWALMTPVDNGGKGPTWITAAAGDSINQAITSDSFEPFDINNASGNKVGEAQIVVQPKSDADAGTRRRITAIGRACLVEDCSLLGPERVVQMIVDIITEAGEFYNYSAYNSSVQSNATVHFEDVWFSGGVYVGHGRSLILKDRVEFGSNVYSHESVNLTSCAGSKEVKMHNGAGIYTFGSVRNKASCLSPAEAAHESYNGGDHNAEFPEIEISAWYDRDWYKTGADIYFPADAKTNPSAEQDVIFCSDSDGHVHYVVDDLSGVCSDIDPLLTDGVGNPFDFGIVFVAGEVEIRGTFTGQMTFVAAGKERGLSDFKPGEAEMWIGDNEEGPVDGSDDLRSMNTEVGVPGGSGGSEPGGCQSGIDAVADGEDTLSLIAGDVNISKEDNPCFVRALVWTRNQFVLDSNCNAGGGGSGFVSGAKGGGGPSGGPSGGGSPGGGNGIDCPSEMNFHGTIIEIGKTLTIKGMDRNLSLHFDAELVEDMPPGAQGTQGVVVLRRSYQEIILR